MMVGEYPEVQQAVSTNLYRDMLILRSKDLMDLYSGLLAKYAKVTMDEDLFNSFLSELIVIAKEVYYKLKGSGDKAKSLFEKFEPFKPWFYNIMIPKMDVEEQKKVHELYDLIRQAYDFLGLSPL